MTSAPLGFIVTEDVPNNRWQSYCASGQRRADKKAERALKREGVRTLVMINKKPSHRRA